MKASAILCAAAIAPGLAGCAATTPYWDAHFGNAARIVAAQQVIDPDASLNPDPVTGIDGKAAKGAMEAYHESYTSPTPQPQVLSIDVGSSGR